MGQVRCHAITRSLAHRTRILLIGGAVRVIVTEACDGIPRCSINNNTRMWASGSDNLVHAQGHSLAGKRNMIPGVAGKPLTEFPRLTLVDTRASFIASALMGLHSPAS